jgi:hypothetical protein
MPISQNGKVDLKAVIKEVNQAWLICSLMLIPAISSSCS